MSSELDRRIESQQGLIELLSPPNPGLVAMRFHDSTQSLVFVYCSNAFMPEISRDNRKSMWRQRSERIHSRARGSRQGASLSCTLDAHGRFQSKLFGGRAMTHHFKNGTNRTHRPKWYRRHKGGNQEGETLLKLTVTMKLASI